MVVDASAPLPLVLSDTAERTDDAAVIVERAASEALGLVIPQMWHFELAAVLSRKVRSRAVSNAAVRYPPVAVVRRANLTGSNAGNCCQQRVAHTSPYSQGIGGSSPHSSGPHHRVMIGFPA